MPKVLVFQHVAHEILGTLDPLLRDAGCRIRYVNFGRDAQAQPSLEGYHGLVVLGGPMNLDQTSAYPHLLTESRLIAEAVENDLPVLGVCLGAQLIAHTLGARVVPNRCKEIGWYDVGLTPAGAADPLFQHCAESEKMFQWHGQTFEIPEGAIRLAGSERCRNQAFRYGDNVYGFQFHLEVDEAMILHWLRVVDNAAELEALAGEIDPEDIRKQTRLHVGRLNELSDRVFGEFVGRIGGRKTTRVLPSC